MHLPGSGLFLGYMRFPGLSWVALFTLTSAFRIDAASVPSCSAGARTFLPCELTFDLPAEAQAYRNDVLRVEFRSPAHKTYLMHAFRGRHAACPLQPDRSRDLDLSRPQ